MNEYLVTEVTLSCKTEPWVGLNWNEMKRLTTWLLVSLL